MATNPEKDKDVAATSATKEDGLTAAVRELREAIEGHYNRFVASVDGLESPQAQIVVLALVSKRLAVDGMPLGALIKAVARAYGVELQGLHIEDAAGKTLVHHDVDVPEQTRDARSPLISQGPKDPQ